VTGGGLASTVSVKHDPPSLVRNERRHYHVNYVIPGHSIARPEQSTEMSSCLAAPEADGENMMVPTVMSSERPSRA
jgi:hypothetical protein